MKENKNISVAQMTCFASECFFPPQFPFKANEIWITYKATCFKQVNHNKKPRKLNTFLISEVAIRGVL